MSFSKDHKALSKEGKKTLAQLYKNKWELTVRGTLYILSVEVFNVCGIGINWTSKSSSLSEAIYNAETIQKSRIDVSLKWPKDKNS